jgi:hypothetical protein
MTNLSHGIALMREFHTGDGLDKSTEKMLESLGDTASETLSRKWEPEDRKAFIMVILRSACQIGRHQIS